MRKAFAALFIVCIFLSVLFLSPVPQAQATTIPNPYGVTVGARFADSYVQQNADWIKGMGLQWVRLQEGWATIEGTEGVYNFSKPDADMALAKSEGMLVDLTIQDPPTWALQSGCTQAFDAQKAKTYTLALFARYGAQLKSIEVGNEEWAFDKGNAVCKTPSSYIPVLETVSSALKSAGYIQKIGMWGFTRYNSDADVTNWFTTFLSDPSQPGNYINYFNFHWYNQFSSNPDPNTSNGHPCVMCVVNDIHNVAAQYGQGAKTTWMTEYGWNFKPNPTYPNETYFPDATISGWNQEVLNDGLAQPNLLSHAFFYTLQDNSGPKNFYQNSVETKTASDEAAFITAHPGW